MIYLSTVINGEPAPNYDSFVKILRDVVTYYETAKDYHGFPMSCQNPDFASIVDLYSRGNAVERRLMFGLLLSVFESALAHWKADKDVLYPGSNSFFLSI
jgi:hypothetical protein